jgi:hypothetical protein
MGTPNDNAEIADRFGVVAKRFCSTVDSTSNMDRAEFVTQIYRILPKLIDQAIEMLMSSGATGSSRNRP